MIKHIRNDKGFTLIELMVAMAIFSIAMGTIYGAFSSQLRAKMTQDQVVDMQQTLRGAMNIMQQELRMAGFDPEGTDNAGFIRNFPANGAQVGPTTIAFAYDFDEDGAVEVDDTETIAYRFNNNALERYFNSSGTWEILADNIDAVNFVYVDGDGNPLDDDGAGNVIFSLDQIRSVEITMVGRSGANVAVMSMRHTDNLTYTNRRGTTILNKTAAPDNFRRRMMTAEVICRNMVMD